MEFFCETKVFKNGDIIIEEGKLSNYIYVIRDGVVKELISGCSSISSTSTLSQSRCFGEECLNNEPYQSTIKAIEMTSRAVIDCNRLKQELSQCMDRLLMNVKRKKKVAERLQSYHDLKVHKSTFRSMGSARSFEDRKDNKQSSDLDLNNLDDITIDINMDGSFSIRSSVPFSQGDDGNKAGYRKPPVRRSKKFDSNLQLDIIGEIEDTNHESSLDILDYICTGQDVKIEHEEKYDKDSSFASGFSDVCRNVSFSERPSDSGKNVSFCCL